MNTRTLILFALFALTLGITPYANSETLGTYLFTVKGNDKVNDYKVIQSLINKWFSDNGTMVDGSNYSITLSYYYKIENGATSGDDNNLSVSYAEDMMTGTWSSTATIEFYFVKGANSYAVYWLGSEGATSGDWSTEKLVSGKDNAPELSHITFFTAVTPMASATDGSLMTNTIPEPATLILFGIGLLGFSNFFRKQHTA